MTIALYWNLLCCIVLYCTDSLAKAFRDKDQGLDFDRDFDALFASFTAQQFVSIPLFGPVRDSGIARVACLQRKHIKAWAFLQQNECSTVATQYESPMRVQFQLVIKNKFVHSII